MKFYLDTAIWRDYFEDRSDGLKPLGEFAFRFLKECEKNGAEIIVSDLVVLELKVRFSKEQIKELFSAFQGITKEVTATPKQVSEARKEWQKRNRALPFNDALHAIVARDNKAVMVTRDRHFFEKLASIVEVQAPEDLISG